MIKYKLYMKQAKIVITDLINNIKTETVSDRFVFGNTNFVEYQENIENGLGDTKTILEFSSKFAKIKRNGEVEMEVLYQKGEEVNFPIVTNYGNINCHIKTTGYYTIQKESRFIVRINYTMSIGDDCEERHKIKIEIEN